MKMAKKHQLLLGVGLLVALALGGAILLPILMKENRQVKDDGKIVIGYCTDNLVIERWQRDQEIFRAKAMEKGAEVIVYNANESNENQNRQIRLLIEKKVDVIVVIPYEKDGLKESIQEARDAGIKVIAYDRLITDTPIDAYISFDNVKVGELIASALVEMVPTGDYVVINGSPEDNNSYMFHEGYMNVLQSYIDRGDIRIIGEEWADDWREEPAYDLVSSLLDAGADMNAIIGANDRLAEAAIRALAEQGKAGEVIVAGHDADISACQRIVEGTQHITIYKPIRLLAESAVDLAIAMAKNEVPEISERINNGSMEVPYIRLDVLTVTKDTMEETVIADGFHSKEDIYRQ